MTKRGKWSLSAGVVLLLCGSSMPLHAHNGAVAIAVPVEGIIVDGDLADWPEDMVKYPIRRVEAGVPVQDEADLQGFFRIGYSEGKNALYIAVEALDQSVVIDTSSTPDWDTQDGCEVYIDAVHGRENASGGQYSVRGEALGVYEFADVSVRVQSQRHDNKLWVQAETDREGEFAVAVPPGSYSVQCPAGRGEKKTMEVDVRPGESTQVAFSLKAPQGTAVPTPIGTIDYYGLRTVSRQAVSQVLGIAVGDTLPASTPDIVERLEGVPGVVQARVQPVCCMEGKVMLYVGIAEEGAPQFGYRTPPDSAIALSPEITVTYRKMSAASGEAVRTRHKDDRTYEDHSQGHALSGYPEVRASQERYIVYAEEHEDRLRQVLRHAAEADH